MATVVATPRRDLGVRISPAPVLAAKITPTGKNER